MELRQLEYFVTISKELHFTRAAEKLGMTQPTLSHQIKVLEDEVGVPLFDRIGKKIALTEAGKILLDQCTYIFGSLRSARDQISELQSVKRGTLTIGAMPGELNVLVSHILKDFHRDFPDIHIKIIAADDIVERVIHNEIDFAVTILPPDEDKITKLPLYHEDFYFVVSPEDPVANREKIDFQEIKNMPVIMLPSTHKCRQLIDTTCHSVGFSLQPIIETSSIDTVIQLVQDGLGKTILSKTLFEMYQDRMLKSVPIVNPTLSREIGIVLRKEKFISSAARNYFKMLTDYITKIKS